MNNRRRKAPSVEEFLRTRNAGQEQYIESEDEQKECGELCRVILWIAVLCLIGGLTVALS